MSCASPWRWKGCGVDKIEVQPVEGSAASMTAKRDLSVSNGAAAPALALDEATAERVARISALKGGQPDDVVRVAVEVLDSIVQVSLEGWEPWISDGRVARKLVIFP